VHIERIDHEHGNAKRAWREMGEPEYPSIKEVEQLQAASQTAKEPLKWKAEGQTIHLEIDLPPHAVAAVTLKFAPRK
jgi:xylan 1,4-beta-xylosidase